MTDVRDNILSPSVANSLSPNEEGKGLVKANPDPPSIEKGDIVISSRNFILKVNWSRDGQAGCSYLEVPNALNVFPLSELTLLTKDYQHPFADDITRESIEANRRRQKDEAEQIEAFMAKNKKTKQTKPKKDPLIKAILDNVSPEDLAKLLEEID